MEAGPVLWLRVEVGCDEKRLQMQVLGCSGVRPGRRGAIGRKMEKTVMHG